MQTIKEALSWITTILKKQNIPFQIAGGLAARAYGSTRQLHDIDIDIPEENFETIMDEVLPYLTFGPDHFRDKYWDVFLMTLNYNGQEIDISGANDAKIYNNKNNTWEKIITDFSKIMHIELYGINVPVINREALIAYKKMLARPVDLLDIAHLGAVEYSMSKQISINNALHFIWGKACNGWWLKNDGNFTVIAETMPSGTAEKKHYHKVCEQFFYCLKGQLAIQFNEGEHILYEHEGCSIPPGTPHQVKNISNDTVQFLVISSPNLHDDRVDLE